MARGGGTSPSRPGAAARFPGITWRAFPALMMPVVLLGGIYSGVTTPTEAAAVAAAYAFAHLGRALPQRQRRQTYAPCWRAPGPPPRSAC
jgi:TRAP-type C4-dicarboxylate transport system permease large subunit